MGAGSDSDVIAVLVRHAVAEEAYLYPATRRFVPGGDKLADEELAEHAEAEQTMKRLEETEFTDPAFAMLLGQLMQRSATTCRKRSSSCSRSLPATSTSRSWRSWAARCRR